MYNTSKYLEVLFFLSKFRRGNAMEILKERILQDGRALSETVLKVDSFLNHGVDARLMYEIGTYFKEYYKNCLLYASV